MNGTYINGYNQAKSDVMNRLTEISRLTDNAPLIQQIMIEVGSLEPNWTEPEQPQYARPYGRDQQCVHEQEGDK